MVDREREESMSFSRESDMAAPVIAWLEGIGMDQVKKEFLNPWQSCDLAAIRFDPEKTALRLLMGQKKPVINWIDKAQPFIENPPAWHPIHSRIIAVELKLRRIKEALGQARGNLRFAEESYVAFPEQVALRVASSNRWLGYFTLGIGLLSVSGEGCFMVLPSAGNCSVDKAIQFYCAEKFWRTRKVRRA